MITFLFVWSDSLLLSDMQGIDLAPELAEHALSVVASDLPVDQTCETRIEIRKDGRKLFTVYANVESDMAGSTDNLFDHICYVEKSALEQVNRDRDAGINSHRAKLARIVIDAIM